MREPRFLCSTPESADVVVRPEQGERVMWRGRAGLAQYAFEQPGSLPRWTLPESTQVLVTDRRVVFAHAPDRPDRVTGEVRWLWPQHLRVQPGARSADRGAAASQIQLVCASADGSFPALVLAGGELRTVADADRLANALRLAIARYRVDHAERLGLAEPQTRMLSRLLIGPEFSNHQGGAGQTVSLAGAQVIDEPAERPAATPAERPGAGATGVARVPRPGEPVDEPTADRTERAEWLRRSAARFTGNSARGRASAPARDGDGAQRANRNS